MDESHCQRPVLLPKYSLVPFAHFWVHIALSSCIRKSGLAIFSLFYHMPSWPGVLSLPWVKKSRPAQVQALETNDMFLLSLSFSSLWCWWICFKLDFPPTQWKDPIFSGKIRSIKEQRIRGHIKFFRLNGILCINLFIQKIFIVHVLCIRPLSSTLALRFSNRQKRQKYLHLWSIHSSWGQEILELSKLCGMLDRDKC